MNNALQILNTVTEANYESLAEEESLARPDLAYHYARNVLKCRWPKGEPVIMTSPSWSYLYARYVIEGRWPEAELIIKTSRPNWEKYMYWIMDL